MECLPLGLRTHRLALSRSETGAVADAGRVCDAHEGLAAGTLQSFQEAVLGCDIRIFGNVAVAVAGCQMTENNSAANRGVEMMLLVKSDGRWRIVSQAWDTEQASGPIPPDLCGG